MKQYKGYNIHPSIPNGWSELKNVGSPAHGYVYIYNGVPPIKGGIIGLTHVANLPKNNKDIIENQKKITISKNDNKDIIENKKTKDFIFDASQAKIVNNIARKKMQEKLLNDIGVDLMICEIEGWDKLEYINELKELMLSINK